MSIAELITTRYLMNAWRQNSAQHLNIQNSAGRAARAQRGPPAGRRWVTSGMRQNSAP
jgi:hypothetical protein